MTRSTVGSPRVVVPLLDPTACSPCHPGRGLGPERPSSARSRSEDGHAAGGQGIRGPLASLPASKPYLDRRVAGQPGCHLVDISARLIHLGGGSL
jgi:hypothetical protein